MLWLKKHWDSLLLCLVILILCLSNYTPGTFLIGWDNLMPELNIWLNLKRSILASWQEYQGLGLVGGMGHATDLVRQLLITPLTFIFPTGVIRYLWHFSMLFLGTFGIHYGLKKVIHLNPTISTISALFYLLNFGSIQYFWVAFEPFSTFWGFFPWLTFSLWKYLKEPNTSNLKKLFIVNLLATPSFYVQTIFIVYLICILLVLLSHFIYTHNFLSLKHYIVIVLMLLSINSFWLLPFSYFLKNNSFNPQQAHGNIMATQETVDRNMRRGYLEDFSILRGYYYDLQSGNSHLMPPWVSHFENHYFLLAGYLLFAIIIVGAIYSLLKKNYISLALFLIFIFFGTFLLGSTYPFNIINQLARSIPLIDQVFRSPWTKIIVPLIFSFSIFLGYGITSITKILITFLKYSPKKSTITISLITIGLISLISFPVFNGNYFSSATRLKVPKPYFEMIEFFKQQTPTGRIMNLPQGSFFGWTNYNWKMSGSGFIWYGIQQPITDRAFDVWELKNENYFFELSYAIQSRDELLLKNILDKYSIKYIIFDNSVIFPEEKIYNRQITPTHEILKNSQHLSLVANFGHLYIYQYDDSKPTILLSSKKNTTTPPNLSPKTTSPDQLILNTPTKIITSPQIFNNTLTTKLTTFSIPNLLSDKNYLLKINSQNLNGHPLTISIFDKNIKYLHTKLSDSPTQIDNWYTIPPISDQNQNRDLTLLFNNRSFNLIPSVNKIDSVSIYQTEKNATNNSTYDTPPSTFPTFDSNIFYYRTHLSKLEPNQTIVLNQSFSSGWIAFYLQNYKIKFLDNHMLVNNWANGWQLPPARPAGGSEKLTPEIYILFWPQLLQFAGFFLLISSFIFIFRKSETSHTTPPPSV